MTNLARFRQHFYKLVVMGKKFQIDQHVKSFLHKKYFKTLTSKQTFVYQQSTLGENQ